MTHNTTTPLKELIEWTIKDVHFEYNKDYDNFKAQASMAVTKEDVAMDEYALGFLNFFISGDWPFDTKELLKLYKEHLKSKANG